LKETQTVKYPICNIEEIPDEGSKLATLFGREFHVYKVDGVPKVAANVCLHFGGQLECQAGKFVCTWHQAEFALADGRRLKAPAPPGSRLLFMSTRIEDGVLYYVWGE
jgi:nitrite reductase/ring-hydroxylating ferredoxin subunit